MTWTLAATAEPTHAPPRVKLEALEDDPSISLQAVTLYRDGLKLRFDPVLSALSAIAYDYDAPFDTPLLYRADAVGVDSATGFVETWGTPGTPPTGWTGADWAAASGIASSSAPNAVIYRDASSAITSVAVTAPSNMTLQLADANDKILASVKVTPDGMVTLAGSAAASQVVGSGDYTITLAETSISVAGSGWSAQVPFAGVATRVRLLAPGIASYVTSYGTSGNGTGQLRDPRGLAFNAGGDFFVIDPIRNRFLKYNSSGVFQAEYGASGSGSGQLSDPEGIAVDASGNIWVVDYARNRVLKYNSSGVFQAEYGASGSGNGQFNGPIDIDFDSGGNFLVTDYGNNRVQKFNSAGTYQSKYTVTGAYGISIDASDNAYVTSGNEVKKYDSAGALVGAFSTSLAGLSGPRYLDVVSGYVYVADWYSSRIVKLDATTGDLVGTFGANGSGPGQFENAYGIKVRPSGDIYAVNSGPSTDRIQKWTQAGGSVDDITVMGTGRATSASAEDTETLSPTGDYKGAWLTNAAQPELALLIEAEPAEDGDSYFILTDTRESGSLGTNTVDLAIEGSADVVTVELGPRPYETWPLVIACTTQAAYKALVALLANSAKVNLRFPDSPRWLGLDGGFYSVGQVDPQRVGHPQYGPVMVLALPLTPSRAPAYKPLWQWNARTLAQTGMTSADANVRFPTSRAMLVGPG